MRKSLNFLHTKVYRRTFFLYLLIVTVFLFSVSGILLKHCHITARENFASTASDSFQRVDQRANSVAKSIDNFLTQLYTSNKRLQDFYLFFGSSVEDYLKARLNENLMPDISFLSSCDSLVLDSQYAIRHMIFYSRENLVDLEYNDRGYSRLRIITPEQAQQICATGCVYQKDIHQDSTYLGKISFVLDLPPLAESYFTQGSEPASYLVLPDGAQPLSHTLLTREQLFQIMHSGAHYGSMPLEGRKAYYAIYSSELLPYSMIYLSPVRQFLLPQLSQLLMLLAGLVMGLSAITMVLIHRFSRDASYLNSILDSIARAEESDFTPICYSGKNDEYDAIVAGLNQLYEHLESLIQREYKLTISQQKAQMDMLSVQLSPHFLYNTLERIRMRAVLEHAPDVAEGTAGLGLLYRNIVKTKPIITIGRELEITRQYLDLMSFLYGDQYLYHIDVDPAIESTSTPKIWMQPIVENFFKHNFQQDDRLKVVVIEGEDTGDEIVFRFFDNIGHLNDTQLEDLNRQLEDSCSDGDGIGLRNVVHRLRLYYGKRVRMTAENNDPAGICFTVTLKKEGSKDVSLTDR